MEFRRELWLARRSFLAYAGMVALGVASVADYDYSPALNRSGDYLKSVSGPVGSR